MKSLLIKEIRLASHPLTYFFLAFSLMALIPGYPILVGAFFICFGIFRSFQASREANDILYTALLPIDKADAVRAKFVFVCAVQAAAFLLTAALTTLRMTALADAAPYVNNFMMNANLVYLAWTALVFALFNCLFVGPFFRTAYRFGRPFAAFIAVSMLTVAASETLHHVPGLEYLNGTGRLGTQGAILAAALFIYVVATLLSCRRAERVFERIDL